MILEELQEEERWPCAIVVRGDGVKVYHASSGHAYSDRWLKQHDFKPILENALELGDGLYQGYVTWPRFVLHDFLTLDELKNKKASATFLERFEHLTGLGVHGMGDRIVLANMSIAEVKNLASHLDEEKVVKRLDGRYSFTKKDAAAFQWKKRLSVFAKPVTFNEGPTGKLSDIEVVCEGRRMKVTNLPHPKAMWEERSKWRKRSILVSCDVDLNGSLSNPLYQGWK